MIEKRQIKRLPKQALATYDLIRDGREVSNDGMAKTLDVSAKGIHLEIPETVDRGDRLMITISIDNRMITIMGNVVWVEDGSPYARAGVHITPDSAEYQEWLDLTKPND